MHSVLIGLIIIQNIVDYYQHTEIQTDGSFEKPEESLYRKWLWQAWPSWVFKIGSGHPVYHEYKEISPKCSLYSSSFCHPWHVKFLNYHLLNLAPKSISNLACKKQQKKNYKNNESKHQFNLPIMNEHLTGFIGKFYHCTKTKFAK